MEVNAAKIKMLRTDKSWTQQHLADACSVSLRTIQRVERYGNASNETVMSLCAVFEIGRDVIVMPDIPVETQETVVDIAQMFNMKSHLIAMAIGIGIGAIVTFTYVNWFA